jgi:hypothetical protein
MPIHIYSITTTAHSQPYNILPLDSIPTRHSTTSPHLRLLLGSAGRWLGSPLPTLARCGRWRGTRATLPSFRPSGGVGERLLQWRSEGPPSRPAPRRIPWRRWWRRGATTPSRSVLRWIRQRRWWMRGAVPPSRPALHWIPQRRCWACTLDDLELPAWPA